jgi:molybdenum cofactor guanylyltransferase
VGGRRIIDRVNESLRAVTSSRFLVSNSPGAGAWLPGVSSVTDARPERGSLVALHTALTEARGPVLVVAWDMPFVSPELLRRLVDATDEASAVIPEGPTGPEPLCAVYSPTCLPLIEASLDRGDFRLRSFVRALANVKVIRLDEVSRIGDPSRLFFNVNTVEDLVVAERMVAGA